MPAPRIEPAQPAGRRSQHLNDSVPTLPRTVCFTAAGQLACTAPWPPRDTATVHRDGPSTAHSLTARPPTRRPTMRGGKLDTVPTGAGPQRCPPLATTRDNGHRNLADTAPTYRYKYIQYSHFARSLSKIARKLKHPYSATHL